MTEEEYIAAIGEKFYREWKKNPVTAWDRFSYIIEEGIEVPGEEDMSLIIHIGRDDVFNYLIETYGNEVIDIETFVTVN